MAPSDIAKLGTVFVAGGLSALLVSRPDLIQEFTETGISLVPSQWQFRLLENRLPVDYSKLRIKDPKDLVILYKLGELRKTPFVVHRSIQEGLFADFAYSADALKAALVVASQDVTVWSEAMRQLRKLDFKTVKAVHAAETHSPYSRDLQSDFELAVQKWPMDDIATLQELGLLDDTYIKYPDATPVLWALGIMMSLAMI